MPRDPRTTRYLSDLARHEAMPAALSAAVLREIDCGILTAQRGQLAAALEGVCGILEHHRETQGPPLVAAFALASSMLVGNTRRWTIREVGRYTARLGQLTTEAQLLNAWCVLRAGHRAKERDEAAARIQYANGDHFSLSELNQLRKAS